MLPSRSYLNQNKSSKASNNEKSLVASMSKPTINKQVGFQKSLVFDKNTDKIHEMITNITNTIKYMSNYSRINTPLITKELLREGGTKQFYDTFTLFVRGLDPSLQKQEVPNNSQFVLQILKTFNYNGLQNKNIFHPIGAPHTWHHCLSILDFLADLVNYDLNFEQTLYDQSVKNQVEPDQNSLLIKATLANNASQFESKLLVENNLLMSSIKHTQGRIQTYELTIKNLIAMQPSIDNINMQIAHESSARQCWRQQLISRQLQFKALQNAIVKIKMEIQKKQSLQKRLTEQISQLQSQLNNKKQMSLQQQARLQQKIRKGEEQINHLKSKFKHEGELIKRTMQPIISDIRICSTKLMKDIRNLSQSPYNIKTSLEHEVLSCLQKAEKLNAVVEEIVKNEETSEWKMKQIINGMLPVHVINEYNQSCNSIVHDTILKQLNKKKIQLQHKINIHLELKGKQQLAIRNLNQLKAKIRMKKQNISQLEIKEKHLVQNQRHINNEIQIYSEKLKKLGQQLAAIQQSTAKILEEDRKIRQLKCQYLQKSDEVIRKCQQKINAKKKMSIQLMQQHNNTLNTIIQRRVKQYQQLTKLQHI